MWGIVSISCCSTNRRRSRTTGFRECTARSGSSISFARVSSGYDRQPDIVTFAAAREVLPDELARCIVRESRLGSLPGIRQVGRDGGRWRYLLPYMPHYFASLDLSAYDLVIASSHACAINVRPARRRALRLLQPHADALRLAPADGRGTRRRGRRARPAASSAVTCAGPTWRPRAGRTPSRRTRPRCAIGSAASTAATPRSSTLRSTWVSSTTRRRRTKGTSSGCTGSFPTSGPSSWRRRSAACPIA